MQAQLLNLLARGATSEEALKITGASKDLLAECLKDTAFVEELKELRSKYRQELIEDGYARLEQSAITSLKKDMDADLIDTTAKCRILETVAKNRVLHRNPAGHYQNPTAHLTVELRFPSAAQAQQVTIDQKTNQIVAIGERNMSGLPIQGVQKLFKDIEDSKKKPLTSIQERAIIDADINEDFSPQHDALNGILIHPEDETLPSARAA